MYNVSIDEAKARMWADEVTSAVESARVVLKNVATALETSAGSDDIIMQGINAVGSAMQSSWEKMCQVFEDTNNEIHNFIGDVAQVARERYEKSEELKNKIAY